MPVSASLIQNPPRSYIRDQSSISDVAKNCETRASNTGNDTAYALHRPFLTEESPFFKRSHTASSETLRPGSSLSLDGSRASDTVSSKSFGEPLVRPSSVLNYVGTGSSISTSQFGREVCPLSATTAISPRHHFYCCMAPLFKNGSVTELTCSS